MLVFVINLFMQLENVLHLTFILGAKSEDPCRRIGGGAGALQRLSAALSLKHFSEVCEVSGHVKDES